MKDESISAGRRTDRRGVTRYPNVTQQDREAMELYFAQVEDVDVTFRRAQEFERDLEYESQFLPEVEDDDDE